MKHRSNKLLMAGHIHRYGAHSDLCDCGKAQPMGIAGWVVTIAFGLLMVASMFAGGCR